MALSILQMVQRAQAELGLPQSSSVVGTSDATATQMFALANRVLDELRRCNPTGWTAMQFEYNLVVPIPVTATGNLDSAYTDVITGVPSLVGVQPDYFAVAGPNLPQAARVLSITQPPVITLTPAQYWSFTSPTIMGASAVTLSMEATNPAAIEGGTFTFAQDTFPEPAGFDWFQNRTMWDRTNQWELIGPDSPQVNQRELSGVVPTTPRRHYRQVGPFADNWRIWPPPFEIKAPLQLVFEYMSTNAVNTGGDRSTFAEYFTTNSDTCLLDDQAIIMGIKWMFWEIKGMGSYVTLQNRWLDYVDRLIARDGSAPTLKLNRSYSNGLISSDSVQDGNFPSNPSYDG